VALRDGDFILIHYTIKVIDDGEKVVDTTREDVAKKSGIHDPNKRYGEQLVVIGRSKLIDAVDEALREMEPGEVREITAPPEKAYGSRDPSLVIRVPIKQLRRHNIVPRIGQEIEVRGRIGRITRLTERFAYIDFNHPLAGKTLKILLEVVRKLEGDEEKLTYITERWLTVKPLEAKIGDGTIYITLPSDILGLTDLDSRLQLLSRDIYEYLKPSRLELRISIEYPKEEAEAGETGGDKGGNTSGGNTG